MPKSVRKHVVQMPPGEVSEDGETVGFNLVSDDGERFEFSAASDAIEVIMNNLEQLAIRALKRRMELGTDRGVAPRELPALRSISDGFHVEEAEPEDKFEGYRLLVYRLSRPPIMVLLQKEGFEELLRTLREAPATSGTNPKH